jgi:hypothetical protein
MGSLSTSITLIYYFDNEQHHLPHIHARYQGCMASFSILDGECLSGNLPKGQTKMVQAWIEIHRDELLADWELAVNGEAPYKIEPLK